MKRKRLVILARMLLSGMLLIVIFDKPPALPAVMILPPGPLGVKSGRVPDRWMPAKWTWLQRVCQYFLGPIRVIAFNIQFMQTSDTVASIVAQNSLGPAQIQSNGLAVWIVPETFLQRPKGAATVVSAPRAITAEGSQARVMTAGDVAAYSAELFSRLGNDTVDLSTRLMVTAEGQTNFVASMRAQLPYGQALFVLDVRHPDSAATRLECFITANETDPAGNRIQRKPLGK